MTIQVDWKHGAAHMWANHKVTVAEAIGYSHSRQAILTVILVRRDDAGFWGANGWESNSFDRRRYEKGS